MMYLKYIDDFIQVLESGGRKIPEEFKKQLGHKLALGFKEHGDASFELPLVCIFKEIQKETIDIPGWSLMAFNRITDQTLRAELVEIIWEAILLWERLEKLKGRIITFTEQVEELEKETK